MFYIRVLRHPQDAHPLYHCLFVVVDVGCILWALAGFLAEPLKAEWSAQTDHPSHAYLTSIYLDSLLFPSR